MKHFLLLLLLSCSYANAQPGMIKGTVRDANTGEPLIGANVILDGTDRGAVTNIKGEYRMLNVSAGIISLKATYIGYKALTRDSVTVKPYDSTIVDFKLEEQMLISPEILLQAERPLVDKQATNTRSILSEGTLENLPVRSIESNVSTLSGTVHTSNNSSIRGSRSDQTQYVVNGLDVTDPTMTARHSICSGNTEEYGRYAESAFADALKQPISTFSIDVDKAAYSNVRRFIGLGQMPQADAVRIEEMVNYFHYDYPAPAGNAPFSIVAEYGDCPWNGEHRLALVALQGKTLDMEAVPPSNLVFLIDVSGSMSDENKLPLLQKSFKFLVEQLRPQDVISIVVYAGAAGLVLDGTSGSEKEKILAAIENLRAGGSTAGGAGIMLAYKLAEENFIDGANNRIILATDGDFNVGVSNTNSLVDIVEEKRNSGVYISILGFGFGNLKDEKLERLADKGNGMYAYVDSYMEARRIFGGQLAGTLFTIAKDVKLQVEFNPARVHSYRLIGYDNRLLREEDFRNDSIDAGDMGAGHCVTALYEIVPLDAERADAVRSDYKYTESRIKPGANETGELLTVHVRYKDPATDTATECAVVLADKAAAPSENLRFASAVAEFGLLLKNSQYKGSAGYDGVADRARSAYGADKDGSRHEFVTLVEAAGVLK